MIVIAFLFGTVLGLPLVLLLLKVFRGRFFLISSPYFSGALYGFWIWISSMILLVLDARYDFAGVAHGEGGGAFFTLLSSSHAGFLTGGLLAAAAWSKFLKK